MRKISIMLILLTVLTGCTESERISTVNGVSYDSGKITVLFEDGLVITTDLYDGDLQLGDKAIVKHKSNGDIVVSKQ